MNIFPECCGAVENKYYGWYIAVVSRAEKRNLGKDIYKERHHIVPKCLDPNSTNIVKLTAREHFLVHRLLPKIISTSIYRQKLLYALWGMCNQNAKNQNRISINSKTYEKVRQNYITSISGENHWMKDPERRKKMSEFRKGKKCSEEQKIKMSQLLAGREITWKDKIGAANKGKKRTPKMNAAQGKRIKDEYAQGLRKNPTKGEIRDRFICKYCGESCDIANLKKWHNENSNCAERLKLKRSRPGKRGKNKNPYPKKSHICSYCGGSFGTLGFNRWHGERCRNKPIT